MSTEPWYADHRNLATLAEWLLHRVNEMVPLEKQGKPYSLIPLTEAEQKALAKLTDEWQFLEDIGVNRRVLSDLCLRGLADGTSYIGTTDNPQHRLMYKLHEAT